MLRRVLPASLGGEQAALCTPGLPGPERGEWRPQSCAAQDTGHGHTAQAEQCPHGWGQSGQSRGPKAEGGQAGGLSGGAPRPPSSLHSAPVPSVLGFRQVTPRPLLFPPALPTPWERLSLAPAAELSASTVQFSSHRHSLFWNVLPPESPGPVPQMQGCAPTEFCSLLACSPSPGGTWTWRLLQPRAGRGR